MNDDVMQGDMRLLKVGEVAERLRVSRALAYRLIRSGDLPGVLIGHSVRVMPSDLDEYIKRSRKAQFLPEMP